jgi:hypothetical protein
VGKGETEGNRGAIKEERNTSTLPEDGTAEERISTKNFVCKNINGDLTDDNEGVLKRWA